MSNKELTTIVQAILVATVFILAYFTVRTWHIEPYDETLDADEEEVEETKRLLDGYDRPSKYPMEWR